MLNPYEFLAVSLGSGELSAELIVPNHEQQIPLRFNWRRLRDQDQYSLSPTFTPAVPKLYAVPALTRHGRDELERQLGKREFCVLLCVSLRTR